jgi:peroxiredoxin
MAPLGSKAPAFRLPDTQGRIVSLEDFADAKGLLVMFICNHCPYVKHVAPELARLARDYRDKSLAIVAINANDVRNYPDDSPERMAEEVKARGYTFPYLFDASQAVAQAYTAACTPDFFLYNELRELVYRGQLDDSRPGNNIPLTGKDLREAIDAVLAGKPPSGAQRPSVGCNIKWKLGNEPAYA